METKSILQNIDYAPEGIDLTKLNEGEVDIKKLLSDDALNFDINDHPEVIELLSKNNNNDIPVWALNNNSSQAVYAFEDLKKNKDK